jgi:hypothetical protein
MLSKRVAFAEKFLKTINNLIVNKSQYLNYDLNPKLIIQNRSKSVLNVNTHNKRFLTTETSNNNSTSTSSSIDPEEIKRFQALADSWWVENGQFEALHRLNFLRVPLVRDTLVNYRNSLPENEKVNTLQRNPENQSQYTNEELIREPLLGLNILDIGCGGGILAEVINL